MKRVHQGSDGAAGSGNRAPGRLARECGVICKGPIKCVPTICDAPNRLRKSRHGAPACPTRAGQISPVSRPRAKCGTDLPRSPCWRAAAQSGRARLTRTGRSPMWPAPEPANASGVDAASLRREPDRQAAVSATSRASVAWHARHPRLFLVTSRPCCVHCSASTKRGARRPSP